MQINYEDSLEAKSYRDYKGNRTCKRYRDIGEGLELTKETGIAYQRKVAHAEIIKGVAEGMFKLNEVEDLIDQGIASSYALSATNEARKKIEAAQLTRYLLCEDLKSLILDNAVMPIDCENGVLITDFRPDALRINEKSRTVEAIWYRSGSPDINERTGMTPDNHDKMQQWFNCWLLKQYAKKTAEQTFRLKEGDKYTVTGSHVNEFGDILKTRVNGIDLSDTNNLIDITQKESATIYSFADDNLKKVKRVVAKHTPDRGEIVYLEAA